MYADYQIYANHQSSQWKADLVLAGLAYSAHIKKAPLPKVEEL
jgi:hypothetical protein